MPPSLEVRGLTVMYGSLVAVDGIDFAIPEEGTLGLVGESASGKSSVARALVGLVPAHATSVRLFGREVSLRSRRGIRELRSAVQMVFQDPFSSLNPRMTVGATLNEAVRIHQPLGRRERAAEVERLLDAVALDREAGKSYPHQFSGGQRQRIAVARALATRPKVLIADEPTSALDVSVQATVLNLLRELRSRFKLNCLFISHNLAVVRYMSDEVAVMYMGRAVERAPTVQLFDAPRHPYTQGLIRSLPGDSHTFTRALAGEIPDPHRPPSGCRFHTRCPVGPLSNPARGICTEVDPPAEPVASNHFASCHFALKGESRYEQ